jgi:hypothetical protein
MKTTTKRNLKLDMAIAGGALFVGLAISGLAVADILGHHVQIAQATQPLQSTPGAETKPSAPNTVGESQGVRPAEVAPQPARPDDNGVKAGAPAALPPAPAEKTAAPIPAK